MPSPPLAEGCGYKGCDMQSVKPGQSWWFPELLKQYWPTPRMLTKYKGGLIFE